MQSKIISEKTQKGKAVKTLNNSNTKSDKATASNSKKQINEFNYIQSERLSLVQQKIGHIGGIQSLKPQAQNE